MRWRSVKVDTFLAGVRDMLTGALGAYGAGQEESNDEVLLKVVMSLVGTDRSSGIPSLVPCSGDGTTLDEAMQINKMNKLWGTSHRAIEVTALASKRTRCSGGFLFFIAGDSIKAGAEG